jgi:hypothetical protein
VERIQGQGSQEDRKGTQRRWPRRSSNGAISPHASSQSKQAKESAGQKEKEDKPDEEEEDEEEDWGELEELDDYPFSKPDAKDNIVLDVGN